MRYEAEAPARRSGGQRRPARDFPPVVIRDIDPAWLEQVKDEKPAEMTVVDEDPLFYFLNMARTLGPDGLCDGCYRTGDEIAQWSQLPDLERLAIMNEVLPAREATRT